MCECAWSCGGARCPAPKCVVSLPCRVGGCRETPQCVFYTAVIQILVHPPCCSLSFFHTNSPLQTQNNSLFIFFLHKLHITYYNKLCSIVLLQWQWGSWSNLISWAHWKQNMLMFDIMVVAFSSWNDESICRWEINQQQFRSLINRLSHLSSKNLLLFSFSCNLNWMSFGLVGNLKTFFWALGTFVTLFISSRRFSFK